MGSFYPKKPLRSFQDLEVYQKTLEASVLLCKKIKGLASEIGRPVPEVAGPSGSKKRVPKLQHRQGLASATAESNFGSGISEMIVKNMLPCALGIPHSIAEAHSLRFGDHSGAIASMEKAMLNCNKMVVYLEQFRDICGAEIEWEFFDDLIKKYTFVRRKMLNLERSWEKFIQEKE